MKRDANCDGDDVVLYHANIKRDDISIFGGEGSPGVYYQSRREEMRYRVLICHYLYGVFAM